MEPFFLLPHRCVSCGSPASQPLCRNCLARFQPISPPDLGLGLCPVCGQTRLAEAGYCVDCSTQSWSFPSVDGLFGYQEPGGELLRLYKFGGHSHMVTIWASLAAARLVPQGPLVPVPALRRNLWRRGWDPVDTFARAVGRCSGMPVWRVLVRRKSASQKTLDRTGRLENARKAYALAPNARKRLARAPLVWLIDDVVTTGATVETCSRLLLEAGVGEVRVFCLGLH